jgi:bacterial/archaeal transporter family-2 protein
MIAWYLISALAGSAFVVQQVVNAKLRTEIGSAWWAGFISYLGGTIIMGMVAVVLRDPLSLSTFAKAPLLSWTGGLFGAIYIGVSIFMLPKLGATTVIALLVFGQMIGAVAFDHFGLLGVPERTSRVCLGW